MNIRNQFQNQTLQSIAIDLSNHGIARLSPAGLLENCSHFIDKSFLLEYLTVLNSLASNLDIHTIIWSPERNCFHRGLDWSQIDGPQDILEISTLLHKVITISGMMSQNIIIDVAAGAQDVAAEWALSADWRLIDRNGHLIFDHALKGLSLMGGAGLHLHRHLPARYWLLNARAIDATTLTNIGMANEVYQNNNEREEIVSMHIEQQMRLSGMARIQIKQSLIAYDQQSLEQRLAYESSILRATLSTQDWLRYKKGSSKNFIAPSEIQTQIRNKRERENEM